MSPLPSGAQIRFKFYPTSISAKLFELNFQLEDKSDARYSLYYDSEQGRACFEGDNICASFPAFVGSYITLSFAPIMQLDGETRLEFENGKCPTTTPAGDL